MDIKFIRKYKDYIDWEIYTSDAVYLSEDFIREFADYIDWEFLVDSYCFSDEFREEFKEYLEKTEQLLYPNITVEKTATLLVM